MTLFGVEMISAEEIGKELNKCKSDVSKFIAKANLTAVAINKTRYYSKKAVINYLKYGKVEARVLDILKKVVALEKRK